MTAMSDASGTTSFSYDAGNQLLSEDGPWADDTVTRSYTNRLRATLRVQSPNSSDWVQGYGYDSGKRLTSLNGPTGQFQWIYAGASRKIFFQEYGNGSVSYRFYDSVGRLQETQLLDNTINTYFDGHYYEMNRSGQRTRHIWSRTDAVFGAYTWFQNSSDYSYDGMSQLRTATGHDHDVTGTNRLHEQFGYAYDAAGNLSWRTNNEFLQAFNLNNLNELTTSTNKGKFTVAGTTSAQATNVTVNTIPADLYEDATFASTNHTLANGANTFTAIARDSLGRLATNMVSCYLPATNIFSYDLNGNMLSDGTRFFEYDDENELISVTVSNSYRSEFTYDGKLRRRIRKEYSWVAGNWNLQSETRYVYDGNLVIHERDGNNSPLLSYTRGNDFSGTLGGAGGIGGLLARTDHRLLLAGNVNAHAYYHCDGNGNITCLLNTNQIPVARYEYDPYGRILSQSGPLAEANVYRFSSKEFEIGSGLVYYGYRFFVPEIQRWLNCDPIEELRGRNPYQALANNPVSLVDPDGRFVFSLSAFVVDSVNLVRKGVRGQATAADAAWVVFDAAAVALDLCSGGTGGSALEIARGGALVVRASVVVKRSLTLADAAIAAGHVVCMGKGSGGSKNWERDYMDPDSDTVADNFPAKEPMPAGDNQHFNDMFDQVLKEFNVENNPVLRDYLHRVISKQGYNTIEQLRNAIAQELGRSV